MEEFRCMSHTEWFALQLRRLRTIQTMKNQTTGKHNTNNKWVNPKYDNQENKKDVEITTITYQIMSILK